MLPAPFILGRVSGACAKALTSRKVRSTLGALPRADRRVLSAALLADAAERGVDGATGDTDLIGDLQDGHARGVQPPNLPIAQRTDRLLGAAGRLEQTAGEGATQTAGPEAAPLIAVVR